jgi:hypothetical protein
MAIGFPNRSRSFDEARSAVRFSGYDGMFEVAFLVEAAALIRPAGKFGRRDAMEAECLAAFDTARAAIHQAAKKVYSQSRRGTGNIYTLTGADLR